MKWGQKRGSRLRSQKGCRLFVGLVLAVMVAFGSFVLAPVPVARAGVTYTDAPVGIMGHAGYDEMFLWLIRSGTTRVYSGVGTITVSGLSVSTGVYDYGGSVPNAFEFYANTGTLGAAGLFNNQMHAVSFNVSYSNGDHWVWSGSVNFGSSYPWSGYRSVSAVGPLSVALSGPSAVDITVGGTWIATGAGGSAPYTYAWTYGAIGPFFTWPTSGASFFKVLPAGDWTVECQVTDSLGATAFADQVVMSADEVAAYRIILKRVGSVGQYIEATAWDNQGEAVEITATADSQIAIYTAAPDPVGFNWIALDEAVAVQNSLAWRWSGWGGIEHQWFRSTVTLAGGHAIPVTAEFVGLGQYIDVWVTPDDVQIGAPVPPGVEEVEAVWITQAKGILVWLGNTLFVPTQAQLDSLLPSGSLGASLLEGTAWDTGASTWTMHTHWSGHEIMLINVNFADLGVFGSRVKTIVQAGICMALIYMVVVLL